MTNFDLKRLADLKDVESFNIDKLMRSRGIPAFLRWRWIRQASRDNARTPVQWTAGPQAGFTTGTPWLPVNGNHATINYAAQRGDEHSVLGYYKCMIALRAGSETLKYGDFTPLFANRRVMAYARTLNGERYTVLLNLSRHAARAEAAGEVVASNMELKTYAGRLAPFEAVVLCTRAGEAKP